MSKGVKPCRVAPAERVQEKFRGEPVLDDSVVDAGIHEASRVLLVLVLPREKHLLERHVVVIGLTPIHGRRHTQVRCSCSVFVSC